MLQVTFTKLNIKFVTHFSKIIQNMNIVILLPSLIHTKVTCVKLDYLKEKKLGL